MCKEAGGGGREAEEKEPGIQNQKQEPHTKMWGKKIKNNGDWTRKNKEIQPNKHMLGT
jgi:hypothetical protein